MNTLQTAGEAIKYLGGLNNVIDLIAKQAVEIERKNTVLSKAHDALAFAYNDCESDYVRDEKIDPAMDAIQKELT